MGRSRCCPARSYAPKNCYEVGAASWHRWRAVDYRKRPHFLKDGAHVKADRAPSAWFPAYAAETAARLGGAVQAGRIAPEGAGLIRKELDRIAAEVQAAKAQEESAARHNLPSRVG